MGLFKEIFAPNIIVKRKRKPHIFRAESFGWDKDGNLLWHDPFVENLLHDEGEQYILARVFDTDYANYTSTFANLYMGLDSRTPAETDTLASITGEPITGGYQRQVISTSTGFTLAQPGAYYRATSATVLFPPSGGATANMGTVNCRFLCSHISDVTSSATSRLLVSIPLTNPRTINIGDTFQTNMILGLSE